MAGAGPQISLVSFVGGRGGVYLSRTRRHHAHVSSLGSYRTPLSLCMSLFALLNGLPPSRQKRRKGEERDR